MQLLLDLYNIYSPSHYEFEMADFIAGQLDQRGIPFQQDNQSWQIYRLDNPGQPMVCAHMDQVQSCRPYGLTVEGGTVSSFTGLGADDKNGLWIVLMLLQRFPELNFIFSTAEEVGGNLAELLIDVELSLQEIPYALVFDRKGGGDIIGTDNNYCEQDFETVLASFGKKLGFAPTRGVFSDCDALSEYIACANISCGYYNAHSDDEYTVISELVNSLDFAKTIITEAPRTRYEVPEPAIYAIPTHYQRGRSSGTSGLFSRKVSWIKDLLASPTKKASRTNLLDDIDDDADISDYYVGFDSEDIEVYCPECYAELDPVYEGCLEIECPQCGTDITPAITVFGG